MTLTITMTVEMMMMMKKNQIGWPNVSFACLLFIYFVQFVLYNPEVLHEILYFNHALSLCVSCLEGLGVENTAVPAVQIITLQCAVQYSAL